MKIKFMRLFFFFCLSAIFFVSCKKDDYLSGGSLHNAITPLNNMEYMKANAFKLFDTATLIIDRMGLANAVNDAKTFFAFTDYSVQNMINVKLQAKRAINPSATYTLDSLLTEISADSIRQYMFKEQIELETAPELKANPFTSLGNTTMGIIKQLQSNAPYVTSTRAPTYLLIFVKVRGALDEPGVTPPLNQNDINVLCQTTGIKTSDGETTLHVLSNTHTFVRF